MRLFKRACAVGMAPNDFWDSEPADSSQYIEARDEESRRREYSESLLTAQFFGIVLGNAFRDKGAKVMDFPKFDEIYGRVEEKTPEETQQEMLDRRVAELKAQFALRATGG